MTTPPPPPAPWPPTRWTPPLTDTAPSLYGRYAAVLGLAWTAAMGYQLDGWQAALLTAVTEEYPEGHPRAGQLRYRQVLISVGRQNGKSEIAAALGLLFMLARPGAYVIGIATTAEQARLVYKRAMRVILANKALRRRFEALTETRGLRTTSGAQWELKASKSAALQGIPLDLGVVDEVHLVKRELWHDLTAGTGGRPNTLVVGITTAGDEASTLLRDLYDAADAGQDRLGHFIWEAPVALIPDDDATLLAYLMAANPALAAGRLDVANVISDTRSMPKPDAVRYRLNRFTASTSSFVPPALWGACAWGDAETFPLPTASTPTRLRPVLTVDRTPDWSHATVTATVKTDDGLLWTQVVASIVNPTLDRLETICVELAEHRPAWYAVDGYALRDLATRLERRGLPVQVLRQVDVISASSLAYAAIIQRTVRHGSDPLLTMQLPRTARKNVGTAFRVSRIDSASEIDAVMATVLGMYVAETVQPVEDQLFL